MSAGRQLLARANKVFPGNKWTRSPFQEPWYTSEPAYPTLLDRGEGCRVYGTEGEVWIDYLSGFGANILGYGHPEVEAAAAEQAKKGATLTGPTVRSIELAERLTGLRPGAEWAVFAKNGTDVTSLAKTASRAATGKRGILREQHGASFGYHGASPGWLRGAAGVLPQDGEEFEVGFKFNDLESVEQAVIGLDGDCAAIFVGGLSYPYSAPMVDPTPEFARGLRDIADAAGAMLVLDEIRTTCRVGSTVGGGHWSELATGTAPDMYTQCKAIANGHPIAALLGNERARDGAAAVTASGTYWLTAAPMAAALRCVDILEADDSAVMKQIQATGQQLVDGLRAAAAARSLSVTVSGPVAMPFLTFDDEVPHKRPKSELWCAVAAKHGAWFHPHHNWYLTASHTADDIEQTVAIAGKAFDAVADAYR